MKGITGDGLNESNSTIGQVHGILQSLIKCWKMVVMSVDMRGSGSAVRSSFI